MGHQRHPRRGIFTITSQTRDSKINCVISGGACPGPAGERSLQRGRDSLGIGRVSPVYQPTFATAGASGAPRMGALDTK